MLCDDDDDDDDDLRCEEKDKDFPEGHQHWCAAR